MSTTKFALVLSPDPSTEDVMMALQGPEKVIRSIDFNTHASGPSLAAVFEIFSEDIVAFTQDVRKNGLKIGVYSTEDKADRFAKRAFNLPEDGTLEEVLTLGGGET